MFYTMWEPKTKNRFVLNIDGIPTYLMRKTDRPKWTQERKTIDYINLQWFFKGKTTWQEMSIELYDPIVPSAAQAVFEWFRLSHESVTGRDGYQDFYKKDITSPSCVDAGRVKTFGNERRSLPISFENISRSVSDYSNFFPDRGIFEN